jgi:hypothetical protein
MDIEYDALMKNKLGIWFLPLKVETLLIVNGFGKLKESQMGLWINIKLD